MKKFLSMVCCLTLVLSLMVVPTFALSTNPHDTVGVTEVTASTISPRVATQGLWYRENLYFDYVVSVPVTPESGAALNVWLQNSIGSVNVTVYQTNAVGLYTQVYSQTFSEGERDVNVVSSCNGRQYLVKFTAAVGGSLMSALIYQH